MFLNLLGIIGLFTSFLYIIYFTLTGPVYTYPEPKILTQVKPVDPPSPALKAEKPPVVYSGYCLNVPILMYHHVQPRQLAEEKWQTNLSVNDYSFDKQMSYLSQSGYSTMTLEQLSNALINRSPIPTKSIVLTFDDGYEDFYTYAYPILKKYNQIGNLMLSTGLVNNSDYLNWRQVKEMSSSGVVKVYNHTWSHHNLSSASSEKIDLEISTAQKQLQDNIGYAPKIFAYPYGGYSESTINYLKINDFTIAVSTEAGQVQCNSFLMTLHRTRIGNSQLSYYGI